MRQVVERALEKAPDARWLTAPQMAEAARAALAAPGSPVPAFDETRPASVAGAHEPADAPAGPSSMAGAAGTAPASGVTGVPLTTPGTTATSRRRTLRVVATMSAAVIVSAAVAGFVWFRPTPQAVRDEVPLPPVSVSSPAELVPTTPSAVGGRRHTTEPTKRQPTPRATRATPVPSPSPTVTTSSPVTESPTATPTTSEPEEPTQEPTTPGPEEPTSEPTITGEPGEIQCIRSPCP